jgi:hypothetical protein
MSRIHPVFHIVKLLPTPDDPIPGRHFPPPPEPEIIDGEERYELEKVLDSRWWRRKLQFKVSWKGYGYEHNSWIDENDMSAPGLLAEFYREHLGAPRRIQTIQFGTIPFQMLMRTLT